MNCLPYSLFKVVWFTFAFVCEHLSAYGVDAYANDSAAADGALAVVVMIMQIMNLN